MSLERPSTLVPIIRNLLTMEDRDPDVKTKGLELLMALTNGVCEETDVFADNIEGLLDGLSRTFDSNHDNAQTVCLCLANLSTLDNCLHKIVSFIKSENASLDRSGLLFKTLRFVNKYIPGTTIAVLALLCNLTRRKDYAIIVYEAFVDQTQALKSLIELFFRKDNVNESHEYISYLLANLCQLHEVRMWLMNSGNLQRLLPFLNHEDSFQRTGVIMVVKNCCFETEKHEWLLSEELNLLSRLLLPLAGPEQFDDDDNDKLPLDLQYLPLNKTRESNVNLRLTFIQTLNMLCATRNCRKIIRDQGTYLILRELHNWEPNKELKLACENLVDILIKTEDEIGIDNFHDVDVPKDVVDFLESELPKIENED